MAHTCPLVAALVAVGQEPLVPKLTGQFANILAVIHRAVAKGGGALVYNVTAL